MTAAQKTDRFVATPGRGVFTLAGAVAAAALGFIFTVLVGRRLGAEGAGIVFSVVSLAFICSNVLELGADTGLLWRLPRLLGEDGTAQVPRLLVLAIVPTVVAGAAGAGLLLITEDWWTAQLSGGEDTRSALRAAAVAIALGPASAVVVAGTRGLGALAPFVLLQNVALPALRLLALAIAGVGTVAGAAMAWSLPYVVVLSAGLAWLVVLARTTAPSSGERPTARNHGLAAQFWRFSAPRGVTATMETLLVWLNVLVVGLLAGPVAAGLFGATSRFVTSGTMAEQAVRVLVAPRFSALLGSPDRVGASDLYRQSSIWVLCLSWPLYLAVAAWAPLLLGLFGPEFVEAAPALTLLCGVMVIGQTMGVAQTVLLMSGRSGVQLANKAASLGVLVLAHAALTSRHGVLGAAIAWSLALLVDLGLALFHIRDVVTVSLDWRLLARIGAAASLFVAAPSWLAVRTLDLGWSGSAGIALLGGAGYLAYLASNRGAVLGTATEPASME